MAALSGPQDQLYSQVQQLERVVRDQQAQLGAAAKQVRGRMCGGMGANNAGVFADGLLQEACPASQLLVPTCHRQPLPCCSRHLPLWLARRRRSTLHGVSGCAVRLQSSGLSSCRWGPP